MSIDLVAFFLTLAGPWTLIALLLWGQSIWALKPYWNFREMKASALLAFLGSLVAFLTVDVAFKVLGDETNLLSVANMLALFGKASNTQMWVYHYHSYHVMDVSVPSRPILFPLLTALVHSLSGFRETNAFVVNFICLFSLLFLSLEWGKKKFSQFGTYAVWLALMMNSVLLLTATSAGFDLCSLLFGFMAYLLLKEVEEKKTEAHIRALFLTLVCFASIRYESILTLPLAAAYLYWLDRKRPIPVDLYSTVGLLIVPLFVQRYLTWGSFENPPGVAPFSLLHLWHHLPDFFYSFFLDAKGPYPILLHWLGLGGIYCLGLERKKYQMLALGYGGFLLGLLLSHHFGLTGHPTQVRLFLPLSFGLSLLGIHFLSCVKSYLDMRTLLGVFAVLFMHHHHYSMEDPLLSQLTMTREVRHIRKFIQDEGQSEDLWIYDRPGQLAALGQSAVSWEYFNKNRAEVLRNLKMKLYRRVLVIERVEYNGDPEKTGLIRAGYRISPLREHQLSPDERLRISRLEWL